MTSRTDRPGQRPAAVGPAAQGGYPGHRRRLSAQPQQPSNSRSGASPRTVRPAAQPQQPQQQPSRAIQQPSRTAAPAGVPAAATAAGYTLRPAGAADRPVGPAPPPGSSAVGAAASRRSSAAASPAPRPPQAPRPVFASSACGADRHLVSCCCDRRVHQEGVRHGQVSRASRRADKIQAQGQQRAVPDNQAVKTGTPSAASHVTAPRRRCRSRKSDDALRGRSAPVNLAQ